MELENFLEEFRNEFYARAKPPTKNKLEIPRKEIQEMQRACISCRNYSEN